MSRVRVLFLCTGNSARSIIGAALLRQIGGDAFDKRSAGTHPKGINPYTVRVLEAAGIDASGERSRDVSELVGEQFDYVITVCDSAAEECPIFPGAPMRIHWSFVDPAPPRALTRRSLRHFSARWTPCGSAWRHSCGTPVFGSGCRPSAGTTYLAVHADDAAAGVDDYPLSVTDDRCAIPGADDNREAIFASNSGGVRENSAGISDERTDLLRDERPHVRSAWRDEHDTAADLVEVVLAGYDTRRAGVRPARRRDAAHFNVVPSGGPCGADVVALDLAGNDCWLIHVHRLAAADFRHVMRG